MNNHLLGLGGRHCECGALAEDGSARCRKCRSRSRWLRRRAAAPRRRVSTHKYRNPKDAEGGEET
jgi:hypothetical protein